MFYLEVCYAPPMVFSNVDPYEILAPYDCTLES